MRVVIVDDDKTVRHLLRMLLDLEDDFEVVGEAADGADGLALINTMEPDVIVTDLQMPDTDGRWLIEQLQDRGVTVPVVVITTRQTEAAELAGVARVLPKYRGMAGIATHLRAVVAR